MAEHMSHDSLDRERISAVAVRLINLGWFRVGSERYAKTSKTFGITTLTKRHVSVRGSRSSFRFVSKHRVRVRTALADAELADAIKELRAVPGGRRLFRYEWEGELYNLTGRRLNDYIREYLGEEFTVSPAVIEQYLDGRTIDNFRPRHLRVVGARDIGLDREEQALLSLLRSWRIRRSREAA